MVSQLRRAGIDVRVDPEEYLNGKFASLRDPEGNVLQLWEPAGVDARRGRATDDVRTQQRIQ